MQEIAPLGGDARWKHVTKEERSRIMKKVRKGKNKK